uniref:non-specific serine/threonine protein kinase n=1 Tax=Vannella robusta TaxID=1487602 RepID=A0A7S4IPX5_9EUKA|mmetsp:Transcript_6526/g.8059  ORF Transcript_6526/g.8059 Transcript_6526/m.8059 type:complete len:318 (+) Transcript_6526:46-999(+)
MGGLLSRLLEVKGNSLKVIQLHGHQLKIEKQIGEGGFAVVYLVVDKQTGKRFALKQFNCLEDEQHSKFAHTELETLKKFTGKSPHIIDLVDTDGLQFALLPFYPCGTLQSIIDKERELRGEQPYALIPGQFHRKEIIQIAMDVCEALSFFHGSVPPLAHRDISSGNILIKKDNETRRGVIMDFGSTSEAKVSTENYQDCMRLQELAEMTCSVLYRAPELHEVVTHSLVDERTDVWSVGCVIYFMMYGISPFEFALKEGGSIKLAAMGASPVYHEQGFDEELVGIMKSIFTTEVENRPTIAELRGKLEELVMFDQLDR